MTDNEKSINSGAHAPVLSQIIGRHIRGCGCRRLHAAQCKCSCIERVSFTGWPKPYSPCSRTERGDEYLVLQWPGSRPGNPCPTGRPYPCHRGQCTRRRNHRSLAWHAGTERDGWSAPPDTNADCVRKYFHLRVRRRRRRHLLVPSPSAKF